MINDSKKVSHYIEALSHSILTATPYYADSIARLGGKKSIVNTFPNKPGIYLILRRVQLANNDYTTRGVNTKVPLILYVGKTTSQRTIRKRLGDHFGGIKPNYQGSQFRKFLFQICQDHGVVKSILWSPDTLIAFTVIEEDDVVIDFAEKLAIKVFQPRFNLRDR